MNCIYQVLTTRLINKLNTESGFGIVSMAFCYVVEGMVRNRSDVE